MSSQKGDVVLKKKKGGNSWKLTKGPNQTKPEGQDGGPPYETSLHMLIKENFIQ
jgi:hypothetical protein